MKILGNIWYQDVQHLIIVNKDSQQNENVKFIRTEEELNQYYQQINYWSTQQQNIYVFNNLNVQQINPFVNIIQFDKDYFSVLIGQNIKQLQDDMAINIKRYLECHSISCQAASHPRSIFDAVLKIYEIYQIFTQNISDVEYQSQDEMELYEYLKDKTNYQKLLGISLYISQILSQLSKINIQKINIKQLSNQDLEQLIGQKINIDLDKIQSINDIKEQIDEVTDDYQYNIQQISYILAQVYCQSFNVPYDINLLNNLIYINKIEYLEKLYNDIINYCSKYQLYNDINWCMDFQNTIMKQKQNKYEQYELFGNILEEQCLNIVPQDLENNDTCKEFLQKLKSQNEKLYLINNMKQSPSCTTVKEIQQLFKEQYNVTVNYIITQNGSLIQMEGNEDKNIFVLAKIKKTIQYATFVIDTDEQIDFPQVRIFRNKIN